MNVVLLAPYLNVLLLRSPVYFVMPCFAFQCFLNWTDPFFHGRSPTFLRPLKDWGLEEIVRFLQTLHDQNFRPTGEDKLLLKAVKEKRLSVKIMYKDFDISPAFDFTYRLDWNPVVP